MKNIILFMFGLSFVYFLGGCKEQFAGDEGCPICPVITKITPDIAQEGNEVTITGERFGDDKTKVTIDILTQPVKVTLTTSDITSIKDSEIKFKVPLGKSGSGKVVLSINAGQEILTSNDPGIFPKPADIVFNFKGKGSITNSTPISGRVGDEAIITGVNFGTKKEDVRIKIGDVQVPQADILLVTDTEIKFKIPPKVPESGLITLLIGGFPVGGSPTFLYKWKTTTTTLLRTNEVGGWAIDKETEAIYFITYTSEFINGLKATFNIKKFSNNALVPITDQKIVVSLGDGQLTNPLDLNQFIAFGGMIFIPYQRKNNGAESNGIIQIVLDDVIAKSKNFGASFTGQSGTYEAPRGIPSAINGKITSLGIQNRNNMYVGIATNLLYSISTSQVFWTAPFDGIFSLPDQIKAIGPTMYSNSKLYIPVAGGIMSYDFTTKKLEQFVGSQNAVAYNSKDKKGDGEALLALFNNPLGIAQGSNSSFYVADTDNALIRLISKNTEGKYIVSTIAGIVGQAGNNDGTEAKFERPKTIYVAKNGIIYIIDSNNKSLRSIKLE
jgi:IPT/TIG domain